MMKKKLLFIGIIMNSAGTENSFLSLANSIDYSEYEVDLLLAKKEGLFMELIPKEINVIEMKKYGELFLLSGKNAIKNLMSTFVKEKPLTIFEILPYFFKIIFNKKKKIKHAIAMWIHMMQKLEPIEKEYDAAISFWGDRTMFYMIDKVKNAKKKITWLHFDYDTPPRDDEIYLDYFSKCDKVVNVSTAVDDKLKQRLPKISDKCMVIENIQNAEFIRRRSLEKESFPDNLFKGKRILTVGRFAPQKGYEMIPPVLAKLRKDGYDVRWYILGDGEEEVKQQVINLALEHQVADCLIFLGVTLNPYPYMKDCDIFCMTSRYEGKPISVEEAKIMRCPIVITNYHSANEQLANGKYGLVCEINEEGIYNGVKTLLDSPELCEQFSLTLHKEIKGNESEVEKFYDLI